MSFSGSPNYFPPPREHFLLNLADRGKRTRDFIRESIHTIKSLGIDYYSVHGGFVKDYAVSNEKLFPVEGDVKYTRYDILDAINWFNGEFPRVPLALENMYPVGGAETCFMMEVSEITWLLEHHDSVFLLLDLGHLKISAKYFGFDYLAAAEKLVSDYGDRIIEIHISENDSVTDSHFAVTENSGQYQCIKQYYNRIRRNGTNIVMEIRNSTWDELVASYNLFNSLSGSMNE